MMLLLVAAAVFQGQVTAISYSGDAKPVGTVLQEISSKTGLHLMATQAADQEIVLVRVQDLPTKEFLDDLANVTSCQWERNGDVLYLKPDLNLRSKEEQTELASRAAKIAKEIKERTSSTQKIQDKSDPGVADLLAGDLPILTLLRNVDPSDLASIGPGDRKVWATNDANPSQIGIQMDPPSLVTDWIAQHNASVVKAPTNDQTPQGFEEFMPQEMRDMFKRSRNPVKAAPFKSLLTAKPMAYLGGFQLGLTVYDAQGAPLLESTTVLGSEFLNAIKQPNLELNGAPPSTSTKIEYSEDSKLLMKGIGQTQLMSFGEPVPAGIRNKFARPDRKDPLSYVAQDRLLAVAQLRKKQLIADIPDAAFGVGGVMPPSQSQTAEEASTDLSKGEILAAYESEGVLLVKSAAPAQDRINRMDRAAMALLVAQQAKNHVLSLDDVCTYALSNEAPTENPVALAYAGSLASTLMSFSMEGGIPDWDMYRLYGSLDQSQRLNLRNGGSLPFAAMSGNQLVWIRQIVMGASAHLRSATTKVGTDFISQMMFSAIGSSGNGRFEPTEVMPNGVPSAGYLTCAATNETVLQLQMSPSTDSSYVAGPGELALFKMVSDMKTPGTESFHIPTSGVVGERTNLAFAFHVSADMIQDERLSDVSMPTDGAKVALGQLPSDLQAQVDAQSAALKKSPFGMMMQNLPIFKSTPTP